MITSRPETSAWGAVQLLTAARDQTPGAFQRSSSFAAAAALARTRDSAKAWALLNGPYGSTAPSGSYLTTWTRPCHEVVRAKAPPVSSTGPKNCGSAVDLFVMRPSYACPPV